MSRVAIELTLACDGACRFCAQRGLDPTERDAAAIEAEIEAAGTRGDPITFVGGEPTGRRDLVHFIRVATKAGAPAVGLQTHARALADPTFVAALVQAGLTDAHVSLHGARPEIHDYHTSAAGSFEQSLAGIVQLRAHAVAVVANTVVTRSNFRGLSELPQRLRAWGVSAWCVSWPIAVGGAQRSFDRIVPRLGLAAPFVLHAIDAAQRLGLPAFSRGLPRCVLGPWIASALDAPQGSFSASCDHCDARPSCSGVDRHYLDRFSADELHPLDPAPSTIDSAAHMRWAPLFVGAGTQAPVIEETVADSPGRARARLPVLGRPDPARQEARGKSASDGEALRELFPELFGGDEE